MRSSYGLKIAAIAALSTFVNIGSARAATLAFDQLFTTTDDPVIQTAPTISVNDDTAGVLTFDILIQNANALISAVYIDLIGSPSVAFTDLASLTSGVDIVDFANDTNDIGNGRSLSGTFDTAPPGASGAFTFGFGFDDGDGGGAARQAELPFSFTLDNLGSLSVFDVSRIGLRFQSVGTLGVDGLGGGSEKLIALSNFDSSPPPPPAPVPLPAALPMMVFGLASLGLVRFRRKNT